MDMKLDEILNEIEEKADLDLNAVKEAEERQEVLAKPTGALGDLEKISIKLSGITGKVKNEMKHQAVAIFSADNGVVEEGVASAPQSVTYSQTINFTRRLTGVGSMAKYYGIDLLVVDMGMKTPAPDSLYHDEMFVEKCEKCEGYFCKTAICSKIVNRRLGEGTKNFAKGSAMTNEEAVKAFLSGVEAAYAIKKAEFDIFGVGEMGIGNTTTSAAVLSALTGRSAEEVVGRGGGLNDEGLKKKVQIVEEAVKGLNPEDVLGILAKVGGFDICAMVGAYIGAAYYRMPVVIDGYISAVAALAASVLAPKTKNFMFTSHKSLEPGYKIAIDALEIKPMFDLGMRLGEGSGCPIAFKIIETACATMNGMATYQEGAIDADYLDERKKGNFF